MYPELAARLGLVDLQVEVIERLHHELATRLALIEWQAEALIPSCHCCTCGNAPGQPQAGRFSVPVAAPCYAPLVRLRPRGLGLRSAGAGGA